MHRSARAKPPVDGVPPLADERSDVAASPADLRAAEDSTDKTALTRFPSEPTQVTSVTSSTPKPVRRGRRNYTWFNPEDPRLPVSPADVNARDPAEVAAEALANAPRGDRPPPIVRIREVRRDYEYHYEYIYQEGVEAAEAGLEAWDRAPAPPEPIDPGVALPPPVDELADEESTADQTIVTSPPPEFLLNDLPPAPSAPGVTVAEPVAAFAPVIPGASVAAARESPLRARLASRAHTLAFATVGVILAGLLVVVSLLARSAIGRSAASTTPVTRPMTEAPLVAPPTSPPAMPPVISGAAAAGAILPVAQTPPPVVAPVPSTKASRKKHP